ncbi:MAG: Tol-Pal system beta propeller repeat protein TolB [Marinobacter sp.]|nr:Tol-Pal system beta propeller repeat protein TolB [Marinobacter sp.]
MLSIKGHNRVSLYTLVLLVLCIGLLAAPQARGELLIRITEGVESAIPIAVVPFKETGQFGPDENVSNILRDNLQMSGEFNPLRPANMLSLPSRGEEVFYRDWRMLGQQYLVVGEAVRQGDQVQVRYEVFTVNGERRILGETATAPITNIRGLAHHISDKVYEAITGVRGAFSTRLAYITVNLEDNRRIYRLHVSDMDGRRSRVRLESNEPVLSPSWSPDGRSLAYVSFESGKPAIYTHELATGQRVKVADFPGLNSAPAWSPDGRYLLLTLSKDGNPEIYRLDLQTRALRRLTNHAAIDTEADWDSRGRGFVFTSDRSGGPQVYLMESLDATAKRLTFGSRYNARPRFSPDGKYVFYVHQREGAFHIARLHIESGEETVLTRTRLDESPSVSPNGRMLIYATREGENSVLTVISVNGGAQYSLPARRGDVRDPAWSPFIN